MFRNKTYDILKWIAIVVLPTLGTLYFALSQIWGFPYGEEVIGTIAAVDVFLGTLLGISTNKYNSQSVENGQFAELEANYFEDEGGDE
jgi:hypothetical protein